MEENKRRFGLRLDHHERMRKKEARIVHKRSAYAQQVFGLRAKLYHQKRHAEKVEMKKKIKMHEEKKNKHEEEGPVAPGAIPAYLMDRKNQSTAKILSNTIKQKKKRESWKMECTITKSKRNFRRRNV